MHSSFSSPQSGACRRTARGVSLAHAASYRDRSDGLGLATVIDIGSDAGTARECGSLERRGEARGQKQAMDALEDVHSVAPSARNRDLVHQSSPHSERIVARKDTPESIAGGRRARPANQYTAPPQPLSAFLAGSTPRPRGAVQVQLVQPRTSVLVTSMHMSWCLVLGDACA